MSIEQMKFAYLKEKGCALTGVRKIPDMGPDDVLVKQLVCNICTTDYGQWLGLREHQGYPMAGGHEGSGIVGGWKRCEGFKTGRSCGCRI